jgi:hypothetical protein
MKFAHSILEAFEFDTIVVKNLLKAKFLGYISGKILKKIGILKN